MEDKADYRNNGEFRINFEEFICVESQVINHDMIEVHD